MNETAVNRNSKPLWELLDAEKPLRMLTVDELRAAMGFSSPVLIFGSPPCALFAKPLKPLIEGGK